MALQRISPGLKKRSTAVTRTDRYSDIDLSFTPKFGSPNANGEYSGDVYKKVDVNAVIQSVETILLTNTLEKPFEPSFGANLRQMLFENTASYSGYFLTQQIQNSVRLWEPRAVVTGVSFYTSEDLIPAEAASLGQYINNTVRIVVELLISNKGFRTSIELNRFR